MINDNHKGKLCALALSMARATGIAADCLQLFKSHRLVFEIRRVASLADQISAEAKAIANQIEMQLDDGA